MNTVYRVQHSTENIGPYVSSKIKWSIEWYSEMMSHHSNICHPNLREDNLSEYRDSDYVCGFNSLDKLKSWFDGYLFNLIDAGFIIAEYEVEDYITGISGKQVVFIPTTFKDITSQLIQSFKHEDSHISQRCIA